MRQDGTTITVDMGADVHPISPLVYGMNYAGTNLPDLNCPLHRIGGNNMSRYNWRENADNRASDWYFESIRDKTSRLPSARVDAWITGNKVAGAASMVTIPALGWVAKTGKNGARTWSYSIKKYGAQEKRDPEKYPDAGNGKRADGAEITGNDPHDANMPTKPAYFQPWITHLTQTFGTAGKGGVAYYILDNEPGLWHTTHRDVFPTGVKMDDLYAKLRGTAQMVKSVDPDAQIGAPEEWGWSGYFASGYDQQMGKSKGWGNRPDRDAHGGVDFIPWLLQQFAQEEKRGGRRLLDVLTVHYYPQGGEFWNAGDVSPEMQARRNRSTRSLWDKNYRDESWIKDTVRLIPRLHEWVDAHYPGTKIGLTEYNWGGDTHMNGATAQADLLGIFGREGLDMACRWVAPGKETPTFKAIQMYRNYDGKKSTFGETSVRCVAPVPDKVAAFAARRKDGALTVMLIAKKSSGVEDVRVKCQSGETGAAKVFQLTSSQGIRPLADVPWDGQEIRLTVPAPSVTLLVLPRGKR